MRNGEVKKGVEEVGLGEVICLPITAPLRLHFEAGEHNRKRTFRTSVSPIWTLFIALRKALRAISLKLQSKPGPFLPLPDYTAKHRDITYVSHITRTF